MLLLGDFLPQVFRSLYIKRTYVYCKYHSRLYLFKCVKKKKNCIEEKPIKNRNISEVICDSTADKVNYMIYIAFC